MEILELDNLYKLYRFEILPISNNKIRIYAYKSKYFSNADIIIIDSKCDLKIINTLATEVESLGYSTTIRNYKTLKDAENNLFDGFFDLKSSNKYLINSYQEYKNKIENVIFGSYQYIKSDYLDVESNLLNNNNIVETIIHDLNEPGPVLIMLEAPAGFGKTSTSYEVVLHLSSIENTNKIPLFTELSRNRQASIFKYVLYDEINRRFTGLNLEIVTKHIIDGNIPVIIDGFDELLKVKSLDKTEDSFEDAEPMLETIKELLHGEAKILLTTRKTAIFSEDEFISWLENNSDHFTFKRYEIQPPTISDWISSSREKELQKAGLNLKSISNPVLLGYLRAMPDETFIQCLNKIDIIIEDYITKLLERENERQELKMTVLEQRKILKHLSRHLTNYDITSENKEIIENLIFEKEESLLYEVLNRFPSNKRPSLEQLLNKLIIHAFLDRKGDSGQQIGFVNDFILGSFVGENLLDEGDKWLGTERFIDFILTAYIPRSKETKLELYVTLNKGLLQYLDAQRQIFIDNYLFGSINRDLTYKFISNIEFRNNFCGNFVIKDTAFSDCDFHSILFDFKNISNSMFINCNFYNCSIDKVSAFENNLIFTNCNSDPYIDLNLNSVSNDFEEIAIAKIDNYEKEVLSKFWPTGKERFIPHKRPGTLRLGMPTEEIEQIDIAIENLIKREILIRRRGHHSLELNIKHLNEIKKILGR